MDKQTTRSAAAEAGSAIGGTIEAAREIGEQALAAAAAPVAAAREMGEQALAAAAVPVAAAQDLARRAGEQASAVTDTLYEEGARASDYLTRRVNEYPLTAVMVAGAIGYGMAYLIHNTWSGGGDASKPKSRNAG